MNHKPANSKRIDVQKVTIYMLWKMMAKFESGFTVIGLAKEIMRLPYDLPFSIGSISRGWVLWQFLNDCVSKDLLYKNRMTLDGENVDFFRPTSKFNFVQDEEMEKIVSWQRLCQTCGKAHNTRGRIPDGHVVAPLSYLS